VRNFLLRNVGMFFLVPAFWPVAVLAQASRPVDATAEQATLAQKPSASTDSLPQLAADYTRAVTALEDARQQRTVALTNLERNRDRVRRELLDSGEVEHAQFAMAAAHDQYVRERDRVIDRLQSDPTYGADRKKVAEIDAQLTAMRQHRDVVDDQTTSLALQRLQHAAEADQLVRNALERDETYQQAHERYVNAAREYHSAVDQIEQRVEADPAVQQARERWQEARDDCQDARMRLAGTQAAYVTALDEHRENMHYLQTHGPSDPLYPYDLGYGGGYGAVIRRHE